MMIFKSYEGGREGSNTEGVGMSFVVHAEVAKCPVILALAWTRLLFTYLDKANSYELVA